MKKKVLWGGAVLTLLLVAGLCFIQFARPLWVRDTVITVMETTEGALTLEKELYYSMTERNSNTEQMIRRENPFPSDNPEDYKSVFIDLRVKNLSFLKQNEFDGMLLTNLTPDSRFIYKDANPFGVTLRFMKEQEVTPMHLLFYKGEMETKELEAYIQAQTVKIMSQDPFGHSSSQKVSLKDASFRYIKPSN